MHSVEKTSDANQDVAIALAVWASELDRALEQKVHCSCVVALSSHRSETQVVTRMIDGKQEWSALWIVAAEKQYQEMRDTMAAGLVVWQNSELDGGSAADAARS